MEIKVKGKGNKERICYFNEHSKCAIFHYINNSRNFLLNGKSSDYFDNWIDDYIEAETEYEALVLAKQWLIDHGYDADVDDLIYKISQF